MKILLPILIFLSPLVLFGQSKEKIKSNIDSVVESISVNKNLRKINFRIQALKKVLHYITYTYQSKNGITVKIERQFSHKNDTINQIFYLKDGQMIYATETIISHYGKDSIVWNGGFYFSKGKLIDFITLGHGKSETENWDPQADITNAFYEARRDIARHRKAKNGD